MDIKVIENNLYITPTSSQDLVFFEEVGIDNMNCVRIFPSQEPDVVNFQLRAKQSLKERQKERNIVATVKMSLEELEKIIAFAKKHIAVSSAS